MAAYKGHHYPGPGNHFCKWSLFYYYFTFKLDIFVNSLVFKKQIVFLIKDIVYICKYTYTFSLRMQNDTSLVTILVYESRGAGKGVLSLSFSTLFKDFFLVVTYRHSDNSTLLCQCRQSRMLTHPGFCWACCLGDVKACPLPVKLRSAVIGDILYRCSVSSRNGIKHLPTCRGSFKTITTLVLYCV